MMTSCHVYSRHFFGPLFLWPLSSPFRALSVKGQCESGELIVWLGIWLGGHGCVCDDSLYRHRSSFHHPSCREGQALVLFREGECGPLSKHTTHMSKRQQQHDIISSVLLLLVFSLHYSILGVPTVPTTITTTDSLR